MTAALDERQLELEVGLPRLDPRVRKLARLPYQQRPYSARNWGHPYHSMCSYPSKIKPGIAHFLVKLLTEPGDVVLDPFAGVGTIPFEACNQGRLGIGSDLNPLAFVVTRAKVELTSRAAVDEIVDHIARRIAGATAEAPVDGEIASFFHPETLREICAARAVLLPQIEEDGVPGASASFVLACLAHILHGNRPYALSRRSHNVIPIPPKGEFVYKPLLPSLREKIDRVYREPLSSQFREGRSLCRSFDDLGDLAGSVDHVLSSPPFLGTTHFVRQNRVRLWLCGWDYEAQNGVRGEFLEHQRGLEPYRAILECALAALKPRGRCTLHLGVVKGTDMASALRPYATSAGFSVDAVIHEDAGHLETHGRTDRGGTDRHQFVLLTKS